jgi:hypothetical protein
MLQGMKVLVSENELFLEMKEKYSALWSQRGVRCRVSYWCHTTLNINLLGAIILSAKSLRGNFDYGRCNCNQIM